jgi:hypothetical protein
MQFYWIFFETTPAIEKLKNGAIGAQVLLSRTGKENKTKLKGHP